jgi:hypothetical protein
MIKIYYQDKNLVLDFSTDKTGNCQMEIFDLKGNILFQQDLGFVNSGINKFELKTNLPIGVYFCKLKINDYSITQKFQIEG